MEDEECTFDELMTLLDEDSEGETSSDIKKEPVTEPVQTMGDDTSDDDIDDDELDRLAAMVADEENEPSTNSRNDLKEVKIEDINKPKSPITIKQESHDNLDAAEKMRLMEERIKMLESQLVEKSQPDPGPSISSRTTPPRPMNPALTTPARPSPTSRNHSSQKLGSPAPVSSERTKIKPEPSSSKGNVSHSKDDSSLTSDLRREGKVESSSSSKQHKPVTVPSGADKRQVSTPKRQRQLKDLEIDLFGIDTSPPGSPTPGHTPSGGKHTKQQTPTSQRCKRTMPASNKNTSINQQMASAAAALQDDDSDWEDLDGERGGHLDKAGKAIDRLLKGKDQNGSRVAHTASYNTDILTNRTPTWGCTKPKLSNQPVEPKLSKRAPEEVDVTHDPFSGIRMVKPLVSSTQMKLRMENRRMVKLSTLHAKSRSSLEGDWVTIGVLVSKSDPKVSQKGNQYSIWTLNDLVDCDRPVKVFLFGESHKTHWKTGIGMVTGILNPSIMQNTEKYQNNSGEMCLTVDHPRKLMLMGTSKDLGFCKGKTKAGRQCTACINKQHGEFCAFHVQSAYRKTSAKRSELQAGHTGVTPRSFEQRIIPKGQTVMYGGQMFSTMTTGAANGKKNKKVSMNSLVNYDSREGKGKLTTLSLHELLPEDRKKLLEAEEARELKDAKAFHDILATPTVGSLNLVKHLLKTDTGGSPGAPAKDKVIVQSIKPGELLKKHRQEIQQQKKSFMMRKMGQQQNKGQGMIDLDEPIPTAGPSFYGNILHKTPQLGRGLGNGNSPLRAKNEDRELAKRKAIFKVQSGGGLDKRDPNALKKVKNNEFQEKIRKRMAENSDNADSNSASTTMAEPPKKRSRLLGDLDLDDPDVKKLLKAKSKHAHKLTEMEEEKQEAYFQLLEKKEAMEQKMSSIYSMKTKAVTCRQCKYTALSALQSCRDQRHSIVTHDAVKRFFECNDCKARCTALDRYPSQPCAKCGGRSFGKAPMMKEKKGPKLPGQELLLRGEEVKYLNSLN